MLSLCVSSFQVQCRTLQFPRNLYKEDSAMQVTGTEKGFNKFINKFVQNYKRIIGLKLPDQMFSLNLGFTSFDFQFKDITITGFNFDNVGISFYESQGNSFARVVNASFTLQLAWKLQQTTYPFIPDSGTGTINVKNINANFLINTQCEYDKCPNLIVQDITNFKITVDAIKIVLEGGQSWIYQSMINLVIDAVKDSLIEMIQVFAQEQLTFALNSIFIYAQPDEPFYFFPDVVKDERYVHKWQMGSGYSTFYFSGYSYATQNYSDEFMKPQMLSAVIPNKFNYDLQLTINYQGFNNVFYILHKYYDAYSNNEFKATSMPSIRFYNTQAIVSITVQDKQGNSYNVELYGKPKIYQNNCIYFEFSMIQLNPQNTIYSDLIQVYMQKAMKKSCYQVDIDGIQLESFQYIFEDSKILRYLKNV
ncbi:BPI-like_protein [Hexamita inflata]|uniref:BPI-like_protein n=1 Tax=Hexamita inflata TaxID=28002 RepID=A0ABP1HI17_9EUKA